MNQWGTLLCVKTRRRSLFQQGMKNWVVIFALIFETALASFICYTPFINTVFETRPPPFYFYFIPLCFTLFMISFDETRKWVMRKNDSRLGQWVEWLSYYWTFNSSSILKRLELNSFGRTYLLPFFSTPLKTIFSLSTFLSFILITSSTLSFFKDCCKLWSQAAGVHQRRWSKQETFFQRSPSHFPQTHLWIEMDLKKVSHSILEICRRVVKSS